MSRSDAASTDLAEPGASAPLPVGVANVTGKGNSGGRGADGGVSRAGGE
ncbi:hypothetical protein ACFO0N_14235 [Halobium salinum]|uniref:Uncharacterized protein n=1 Tax=Halobium salinum TaxID=1364940 RepID=A0ABD5PF12_9EURY|nr:hypothetical protein [Halobium salinum]